MALLVLQMRVLAHGKLLWYLVGMDAFAPNVSRNVTLPLIHCACAIHKCDETIHFSEVLMHNEIAPWWSIRWVLACYFA